MKFIPLSPPIRALRLLFLTAGLAGAAFSAASGGTPRTTGARSSVRETGAALSPSAVTLQQTTWLGGTGIWGDKSAWSNDVPNSPTALATIDDNNSVNSVVTLNDNFTVGALTVNAGDALVIGNQDELTVDSRGFTGAGAITNDGTITVGPSSPTAHFSFAGNVTLGGAGTLTFLAGGSIRDGGTLTIGSSQTLNGANIGTFLGERMTAFVNNGTIDANSSSGDALRFSPGPGGLTNNAAMQASGGGVLELDGNGGGSGTGPYVNQGTITALTGSEVKLASNPILSGGTLTTVGTGTIVDADSATLSDLTNGGTFIAASDAELTLNGTITNNATMTLGASGTGNVTLEVGGNLTLAGTGTLTFLAGDTIREGGTLTIGGSQTVNGATVSSTLGQAMTAFVNHGTIDANSPGNALIFKPGPGGLTNTATMRASGGGILEFDGNGGGSGTGSYVNQATITALAGSEVKLASNPILSGGTLSAVGTGTINDVSGATLSDMILAGTFLVSSDQPLTLAGTITNNAAITFAAAVSASTDLRLQGDVTLAGTGTLTFADGDKIAGGATLTIGSGQTINGATGGTTLGLRQTSFVNHGTINANSPGDNLIFDCGGNGLVSDGLLEASGGGVLHFTGDGGYSGPITNRGTMVAMPGSTVEFTDAANLTNLANNTLTGGTYIAIADASGSLATLDLGGRTFTTNAAAISLSGVHSVFAAVAPLTDNQGSFSLLGLRQFTTAGNLSNEGKLVLDAGSTLHVSGPFTASSASTLAFTIGGTQSQGTASAGVLQVNGTATLGGALTVSLGAGAQLPASSTITILAATGGVSGSFANVPNGERVNTADGTGSFQVNYGPASHFNAGSIVLSGFVASGVVSHPSFFTGEAPLSNGVYYLAFPSGNPFGYYSYLSDTHYIYHFDLGYEYVFDADDGKDGVYFYDFKSSDYFYTSPSFPFPYLYDFNLKTVLYYYPDPNNAGRYNTTGVRYFYDFATGKIISK